MTGIHIPPPPVLVFSMMIVSIYTKILKLLLLKIPKRLPVPDMAILLAFMADIPDTAIPGVIMPDIPDTAIPAALMAPAIIHFHLCHQK